MESRSIMWVGVAQILAVVFGFVALGIVMKYNGWPDETPQTFRPLARGLRENGAWLLAVPLLWTIYAIAARRVESGR